MSGRPRISRPGDPFPGLVLGAILGGVFTRKAEGAAVGAAIGAVATSGTTESVLSLDHAVQLLLRERGIEYISLVRRGPFGANLSIQAQGRYRILQASAENPKNETERDDMLYEEFVRLLNQLPQANEQR